MGTLEQGSPLDPNQLNPEQMRNEAAKTERTRKEEVKETKRNFTRWRQDDCCQPDWELSSSPLPLFIGLDYCEATPVGKGTARVSTGSAQTDQLEEGGRLCQIEKNLAILSAIKHRVFSWNTVNIEHRCTSAKNWLYIWRRVESSWHHPHGQRNLECLACIEMWRLHVWLLPDDSNSRSRRAACVPSADKHTTLGY